MKKLYEIKSISQLHKILGCPKPKHPNISFFKHSEILTCSSDEQTKQALSNANAALAQVEKVNAQFYIISLKSAKGQLKYGRNYYDFEEGTLLFTAPNQVMYPHQLVSEMNDDEGWSLIIQPDLFYGTDLGKKMDSYNFFSYATNEALHISENENSKIMEAIKNIVDEYSQNIDQHSNNLIISNLELLLNYCRRFYDRQFYTRTKQSKDIVVQIETYIKNYFNSDLPINKGIPTVKVCAEHVNLSPNYLSDLLKKETGKNTKEHIDYFLLEKAKQLLLSTELNISEIAYDLGFGYSKSFSKLFKKAMGISPKEFRKSS
jgi:AraC-like DNA-binding protein